jgi:hypothetical protein
LDKNRGQLSSVRTPAAKGQRLASSMGPKRLIIILAAAIILLILSCGDGGLHIYYSSGCGINSAYTGYYIMTLTITSTGDECDPGEINPTPTRIEFGDVIVDCNCDLFFDSLGLLNGHTVLIDFWGDLRDDHMSLITADGDEITFSVVEFEGGDTIWGTFWWDTTSDCIAEGTFTTVLF